MAALYVAEAGALAAREGLADAGMAVDRALLQLWSAEGRGAGSAVPSPDAPAAAAPATPAPGAQ